MHLINKGLALRGFFTNYHINKKKYILPIEQTNNGKKMQILKRIFKRKTEGQTKIFTRGTWYILKNGRYLNGLLVSL